jgi:predicted aspartyl protease
MPITGEFVSGIPYIYAKLILPRLYLVHEFYLLVDTGADSTVVMPHDVYAMGSITRSCGGEPGTDDRDRDRKCVFAA